MNEGKICVSVIGQTAEDLLAKVEAAGKVADIVEVRADDLDPAELSPLFEKLSSDKVLIITFRPRSQGGRSPADFNQRLNFWMSVYSQYHHDSDTTWFDNELDLRAGLEWPSSTVVVRSHHDLENVPNNIDELYDSVPQHETFKMAYTSSEITDAIPVFQVLVRARKDGKRLVPIAMGESGKITRILGLAHGAAFTFASLDPGKETAPGQITADEMTHLYRVKELDRDSEVYGVIAGDTSYSMSPHLHNAAFANDKVNAVFVPLQVRYLGAFISRMVRWETREIDLNFKGFSVTNPHKQEIIKYLDEIDETAAAIGAVNTVKLQNGKLLGYNTDARGFIEPLKNETELSRKKVAVIGAGGAARACVFALLREKADVTVFARDNEKARILADDLGADHARFERGLNFEGFDIVVNATPVGTKGFDQTDSLISSNALSGVKIVYDLTYNPARTNLLIEAENAGAKTINGLEMLIAQAAEQYKIWTGRTAPVDIMKSAATRYLKI